MLLSLVLITVSFRESSTGFLHRVGGGGATVLRPFEVGAERVARPFRDAYGYLAGLVHAKAENERLRSELDKARQTFETAISFCNDVGLLAEEVDPNTGELLGNFPQAFSHIGLVNAAWAISEAEQRAGER